jgi:hypothetical protein
MHDKANEENQYDDDDAVVVRPEPVHPLHYRQYAEGEGLYDARRAAATHKIYRLGKTQLRVHRVFIKEALVLGPDV